MTLMLVQKLKIDILLYLQDNKLAARVLNLHPDRKSEAFVSEWRVYYLWKK